jgi:hypothetical protein
MKVGYGLNRNERDFAAAGAERVYLDIDKTDRQERADLLKRGVQPGDILYIFGWGELAKGGERQIIEARLEQLGVTVKVLDGPQLPPAKIGRPLKFNPNESQAATIGALWYDPLSYTQAYVRRRAEEIMGYPVTRNQLNYRFGKRSRLLADGPLEDGE